MKKLLLLSILLIFTQDLLSQTKATAFLVNDKNEPLGGCVVLNSNTKEQTITDSNGKFDITYSDKDVIIFSLKHHTLYTFDVVKVLPSIIIMPKETNLIESAESTESINGAGGIVSPSNYWIGARVGYNFVSNSDEDNFIGAASVGINMLKPNKGTIKQKNFLSVIGNIGDFKFTKDTAEVAKLQKLAQSVNGISIGLGYEYKMDGLFNIQFGNDKDAGADKHGIRLDDFNTKFFITSQARFTTYKNIGVGNESINFPQNVNTAGVEFSLGNFSEEGVLTLTASGSLLFFDKDQYSLIFEDERSNLISGDVTLIIPIQKKIGFFVNSTFAHKTSALFSFGIVIK